MKEETKKLLEGLIRKGFVVKDEEGYGLTGKGLEVVRGIKKIADKHGIPEDRIIPILLEGKFPLEKVGGEEK